MKLLFICHAYPADLINQMYVDANGLLQIPNNVLQWSIIEGLENNNVDYTIASIPALPAWPRYRHISTPKGLFMVNNVQRGHYLRYYDLPLFKQLSQRKALQRYISSWCAENKNEEKLVALVFTQWSQQLGAALSLKKDYPNLIITTIITDLIDCATEYDSNRSILKKIQIKNEGAEEKKLFPQVDKFVLLTKLMEEVIPEAKDHSMVMEGIAQSNTCGNIIKSRHNITRTLLYTGVLEQYAGVDQMVEAFHRTTNPNYRLVICGAGTSEGFIQKIAESDFRIIFKGRVDHIEVLKQQQQATLLINPRRPNGGITKYSFPSKTMEYMASGTPMIGYKLEGMPEEYFQHMYIPDSLSVEDLTRCIDENLCKSDAELNIKAESAYNFVLTQKNPEVQVLRILSFIKK